MRGTEGPMDSEDRWLDASPAKGPKDDAEIDGLGDGEVDEDGLDPDGDLDDDDLDDEFDDELDDDLIDLDDEYDVDEEVERDKPPLQKRYDD